ncbi:hypothetical protein [Nocardioides sambongensis]|uniref:hypothetical protein n=1 Tax=Nocardioides sambongensis TaxID=2589074 RepID=UPI00112D80F7|nr:hypothetical protein [Nocardioides sambongensis]
MTLVRTVVVASAIEPGDRMHRNGKTRYVLNAVPRPGLILWRTQTVGARSPSVVAYAPDDLVIVWRKPAAPDRQGLSAVTPRNRVADTNPAARHVPPGSKRTTRTRDGR